MSNEGGISGISQEVREVLSWDQVLPSLLKSHCKSEVVHMISSRFRLSWEIEYLAFIFLCPTAVFSCHYQIHFSLLFLYPAASLFTYSGSHALSLLKRYFPWTQNSEEKLGLVALSCLSIFLFAGRYWCILTDSKSSSKVSLCEIKGSLC